jgi:LPS-assembly protein
MAEHRLRLGHASFDSTGSFTHTRDGLNRWHFFHSDAVDLGENMRFSARIQRTSDKTYLQKYEFYDNQPFLESNARLEMFAERGYAIADASVFQELRQETQPGPNIIMPKGNILPRIHGTYQAGITNDLYGQFTGDLMRISDADSSTDRAIGELRLIAPLEFAWQKVTLSGDFRGDFYQYNNVANAPRDRAARMLASGYVDWEMPFSKIGERWTQIIKPKARLTMMGKSNAADFLNMDSTGALLSDVSLFSNNRYSGYDLWVNGTYADYGISWTGYNSDGRSAEVFVGQTYDFNTDGEPTDKNSGYHDGASDIVGRVGLNPTGWLNMTNRFRFGKQNWDLRHLETDVKVGERNFITFGYIWSTKFFNGVRDIDISEGTVGGAMYLTDRLVLRANGIYNFTDGMWQYYNSGIYYEHPCWQIGLVYKVDNAVKVYSQSNENLNFNGVTSLKLNVKIKMGK